MHVIQAWYMILLKSRSASNQLHIIEQITNLSKSQYSKRNTPILFSTWGSHDVQIRKYMGKHNIPSIVM